MAKKRAKKKATKKKAAKKRPAKKRTARRGRIKRRMSQTGTSNRRADRRVLALPPGVRVGKSGVLYTERRANRSDRSAKNRL